MRWPSTAISTLSSFARVTFISTTTTRPRTVPSRLARPSTSETTRTLPMREHSTVNSEVFGVVGWLFMIYCTRALYWLGGYRGAHGSVVDVFPSDVPLTFSSTNERVFSVPRFSSHSCTTVAQPVTRKAINSSTSVVSNINFDRLAVVTRRGKLTLDCIEEK